MDLIWLYVLEDSDNFQSQDDLRASRSPPMEDIYCIFFIYRGVYGRRYVHMLSTATCPIDIIETYVRVQIHSGKGNYAKGT